MAKKKQRGAHEEKPKPQAAPTFRPLEGALKKLAEEKRAADKAEKAEQEKQRLANAAKATAGKSPKYAAKQAPIARSIPRDGSPQRQSTLTPEERQQLDAMGRDDEFFFQRLMSGVVPLAAGKQGRVTTAPEVKARPRDLANVAARAQQADDEVRDHLMSLVEGAARFEVSDDGKRLEGRRLDLGTSTWRRLRLGDLPIDARLDLHGQTTEEARGSLETFLRDKRARKDRVVLVIHGRGEHSPAGVGVLRGEIAAWLSQGRASQHVAAFVTARHDDGGEGALYVLLRP